MKRYVAFLVPAIMIMMFVSGCAWSALPQRASLPAFIGPADQWINSKPLTPAALRGKIVLIDFWEYTCVNCIRTDPYLKAWYERYKSYGFVIVGIQTPEFAFSALRQNVADAAKRDGLTYPILNDPQSKNWQAYNESFWPSKYLFDQQGRLVYQLTGEGGYQDFERRIQKLVLKDHPDAKLPDPLPPVRPGDQPGANCRQDTSELYTNPSYQFLGNKPARTIVDETATFVDRGRHVDGKVYANGPWITRYQSLQHARATTDLQDYIAIRYMATEVNVVINRPRDANYSVYATLDGKPIPKDSAGDDVKFDKRGSYIEVDAPRMFNVIRGPYGVHELNLASDSTDFDIYSYTFSGCPQK